MRQPIKRRAIEDWNDIQFTLVVAQSGSFHAAAVRLDVHETTVSRRIQRLERELGTKLFVRRAHGIAPTPAGESLIARAAAMEDTVTIVRSEIGGMDAKTPGVVRVSVSEGIGTFWLTPALLEFQTRYPQISLNVVTDIHQPDLLAGEADVAITIMRPKEPRLIALQVGDITYSLFATRKYLRQHGYPQSLADLRDHKLVDLYIYGTHAQLKLWTDATRDISNRVFVSNSTGPFLAAIQEGFGIGLAPSFYKFVAPNLISLPILPEWHTELWLVWHEATKTRAKVRSITSFLKAAFARDRERWFS